MARALCGVVGMMMALAGAYAARGAVYEAARAGVPVRAVEVEWKDPEREAGGTRVPVKVYRPADVAGVKEGGLPVILFSHGLGGSRDGYGRWGEYWAARGYVVVHPTHVGSDTGVLRGENGSGGAGGGGVQALAWAANAANAQRRVRDVAFVIDQMEKVNAGTLAGTEAKGLEPLKGKLDVKHVGMAGHSFGAQTTLRVAGARPGVPGRGRGAPEAVDPRVAAAVAMSPQPVRMGDQRIAFGSIRMPVMHVTGTEDASPPAVGDVQPAERRVPFDHSPGPAFLVVFKGATHMTFGGGGGKAGAAGMRLREWVVGQKPSTLTPDEEEAICKQVEEGTTAFWDAHLKGDASAKAWLADGWAKAVGERGTVERK